MRAALTALFLAALLTAGCTPASILSARSDTQTAPVEIVFPDAHAAAAFIAMPGDMVLLELGDTMTKRVAYQFPCYILTLPNLLDFRAPVTNYFHVEIVHRITDADGLLTNGYSPIRRRYYPNEYRNDPTYTIVRIKDFPALAALALRRHAEDDYPKTGFCGDYVAWCFDDRIYSWWNRIPYVQRFFVEYWFPEAIHTGDHLASSPDTVGICRVVQGRALQPDVIDAARLVEQVDLALRSDNDTIRDHAASVRQRLIAAGAVDAEGKIRAERVALRLNAP